MADKADSERMTKLRWVLCILASTVVAFTVLKREGNVFAQLWPYLWPVLGISLLLLGCVEEVRSWRRRKSAARRQDS